MFWTGAKEGKHQTCVPCFSAALIMMLVLFLRETQAQTPYRGTHRFWFPACLLAEERWKEERSSRAVGFIRPVSVA